MPPKALEQLFPGNSECARLLRALEWSTTGTGAVEQWPQSLRIATGICLASRFPMIIFWGPEHTLLYNDAFLRGLGTKHPGSMGQRAEECFPEIWDVIGPMLRGVLERGKATWSTDLLLPLDRSGFTEECYFTFSFSPIHAEESIDGVFCAVVETTAAFVSARRLKSLRQLGGNMPDRTVAAACELTASILEQNPYDVPFAAIYTVDDCGGAASLAAFVRLEADHPLPSTVSLGDPRSLWPLAEVLRTRQCHDASGLGELSLSGGAWPESATQAIVMPIPAAAEDTLAGLLVVGVSPRRAWDDGYHTFFELIVGQIGTLLGNAQAYEAQCRRVEALAEIDRLKTTFFSNISHEFRTPLTLMLGPLEDILADTVESLTQRQRERVEIAHCNSLRLLKLVNALLDFSRIEVGRAQAAYQPTELGSLTADLASNFRSACEKAGLKLSVRCTALPEPVYVDRAMWEKVVLNLISNAFKFTLKGGIEVVLQPAGDHAELAVRDTGCGIPPAEMPRLFERFHQVENTKGRTQEGSGIGLAVVQELVRLHGGEVRAESELDLGSTFFVALPFGKDHLPAKRIVVGQSLPSTVPSAAPFVGEALQWLPELEAQSADGAAPVTSHGKSAAPATASNTQDSRARILLADDNGDMRAYMRRLLSDEYDITAVAHGGAALACARRRPPDLVLADIMMPCLDGFQLLRALRTDARTRELPVILLSARAGQEARAEGLEAGADDYLIKPFSARELLARVGAQLKLNKLRKESAQALHRLNENLEQRVADRTAALEDLTERLRRLAAELTQTEQRERKRLADVIHNHLQQLLVGAKIWVRAAHVKSEETQGRQPLALALSLLDQAIAESRSLTVQLRPPALYESGLIAALRWLAGWMQETHGLKVALDLDRQAEPDTEHRAVLLFEAVRELLLNTVKHAEMDEAKVSLSQAAGNRLCLSVADKGKGFDAAAADRQRSDGFGLFSIREQLLVMGGVLEMESSPGNGTTVRLFLPRDEEIDPADTPKQASSPNQSAPQCGIISRPTAGQIKVLLVDGHSMIRDGIACILEEDGDIAVIAEVANGVAAIEAVQSLKPDVAVIDMNIPGMNGVKTTRAIIEQEPGIKIVGLSIYDDDAARQSMLDAGAWAYLLKDGPTELLIETVRGCVERISPPPRRNNS